MNTQIVRFAFIMLLSLGIALVLFLIPWDMPAGAAPSAPTFTVNSSSDVVGGAPLNNGVCETALDNGVCTLRAAIMKANHYAGGGVAILIPAGTYTLTIPSSGIDGDETTGNLAITNTMTITGAGASSTIIDGNHTITHDRVLWVSGAGSVSISGITIRGGSTTGYAGGIRNAGLLTLIDSAVISNSALYAGGILNLYSLTLIRTTISGNNSTAQGGGIYSLDPLVLIDSIVSGNTSGADGGGVYSTGSGPADFTNSTVRDNASGNSGGGIYDTKALTLTRSTVSGNTSTLDGGGIVVSSTTTMNLINSTVSNNTANRDGGGIWNNNVSTVNMYNTTLASNRSGYNYFTGGIGGGIYDYYPGTFTFQNSIMAYNIETYCAGDNCNTVYGDCAGTLTSNGYNIVYSFDAIRCVISGSFNVADPNLGLLSNNGGATQTRPLLTGSPAIDAGDNSLGGCKDNLGATILTDQRGWHRPFGSRCDIGAYERSAFLFLPLIFK